MSLLDKVNSQKPAYTFFLTPSEFGLSVSDDTIYRALKDLGFSHVSARPKAYRQDAEAMEAFKKTFPNAWRKSARSLRRAPR